MSTGRFWIGESGSEELFHPDGFEITEADFEIAREGRVANGDLVSDVIAVKKLFRIGYEAAVGQDALDSLTALFDAGVTTPLSLILEGDDGSTRTYTVKFRPFRRTQMTPRSSWLYEPVTFTLEEV
jgi:hypothetical protein